jgi:hypothetical protein
MNKIYLPNELWNEIKLFMFHNIKYGKHLKNDKYIKQYNKIMKKIPTPKIPRNGPRIIYSSKLREKIKTYKCFYLIPIKKKYLRIIEIVKIPDDYYENKNYIKYDKLISEEYYNQYI